MKKFKFIVVIIASILVYSCEKVENTSYSIHLANFDSVDYQVQYNYNNTIDTILTAYSEDKISGLYLFDKVFYDQILFEYTEDEFLDKIKTLKIFRISDGDTIYYGDSISYSLELDNWHYDYSEDDGYGLYEYFLRLGID